jgi:hypothetical protein
VLAYKYTGKNIDQKVMNKIPMAMKLALLINASGREVSTFFSSQ